MSDNEKTDINKTVKEIQERIRIQIDNIPQNTCGVFYELYENETYYHELTLYELFMDLNYNNYLLNNLKKVNTSLNGYTIKANSVQKEKSFKYKDSKGRIDIYFEVQKGYESLPVIIELKYNSDDSEGQLEKYYNYIFEMEQKSKNEPFCFYITPDGRPPINYKGDKYKTLTYKTLLQDLRGKITKECNPQNQIYIDYIDTINSLRNESERIEYSLKDSIIFYYSYFTFLKETLLKKYRLNANLQISINKNSNGTIANNIVKAGSSVEIKTTLDFVGRNFDNNNRLIYMKLTIEELALEKRWERWVEDNTEKRNDSSLVYGIIRTKKFKENKYVKLINQWIRQGKNLTYGKDYKKDNINNTKSYEKIKIFLDKEIHFQDDARSVPHSYFIAQILNYWPMPELDNQKIIKNITDIDYWAKHIKEDLAMIED